MDSKVCIGDTSLRKYMLKHIKPTGNINNITCGCKTCISFMLLRSDFNRWRLKKWEKVDKLYINSEATRILQISKIY